MAVKVAAEPGPEHFLRLALSATAASERLRLAQAGLERRDEGIDPDIHTLLLRQAYLAHLQQGELGAACELADQMVRLGTMPALAHHDAARARAGLGRLSEAVEAQRLAVRAAMPQHRSFHLWSLATLQQHMGDLDEALDTLARAEQWATRDRALIRAHAAYVELELGEVPEDLAARINALERSPSREGYGQYLLGMIAHEMGNHARAAAHLRAFLRRNASADPAKSLTLREELARARKALAVLESD